jgi:hypothetical protein
MAAVKARATIPDDLAWRLFFNALAAPEQSVQVRGDERLARPLLRVRSVIV